MKSSGTIDDNFLEASEELHLAIATVAKEVEIHVEH